MNLSMRTNQRRLPEEGFIYRHLRNRLCHEAARETWLSTRMPVKEIARELGHCGTSNFVRGFRCVTGMTPDAYRLCRSGN
ncbi:MAG: helix-turn-helix domain-containing protein [Planctomycetota bacterium]